VGLLLVIPQRRVGIERFGAVFRVYCCA